MGRMELSIIQNMIYVIRGYRVMLDFDLAGIYKIPTKALKQAVKRNPRRFPPDFMFELTKEKFANLRSQFVTSSWGGARYLPFAFTELGATMLSSVLKSDVAIDASVLVVRAFVAARHLALNPPKNELKELQDEFNAFRQYIEDVFTDQNDINEDTRIQLDLFGQSLAELQAGYRESGKNRRQVGFTAPQYKQT